MQHGVVNNRQPGHDLNPQDPAQDIRRHSWPVYRPDEFFLTLRSTTLER